MRRTSVVFSAFFALAAWGCGDDGGGDDGTSATGTETSNTGVVTQTTTATTTQTTTDTTTQTTTDTTTDSTTDSTMTDTDPTSTGTDTDTATATETATETGATQCEQFCADYFATCGDTDYNDYGTEDDCVTECGDFSPDQLMCRIQHVGLVMDPDNDDHCGHAAQMSLNDVCPN